LHHILPGKKLAELLLVANERTRNALPTMNRGKVKTLVENGVDPDLWQPVTERRSRAEDGLKLVFMGRLVDWKRVDIAILALARLSHLPEVRLKVIGDGPERHRLEALVAAHGIKQRVHFAGWLEQAEAARMVAASDCLMLPSVFECGGAVVLEAMSIGLPVIATAWGGPLDYITPETGFLVEPVSEAALVDGFATAIECLARDPDLARRMGEAGRRRVLKHFTWPSKIDEILMHYRDVTEQNG
jgi:glycosyltransferase involved in cell wall biosynthesis